MRHSLRHAYQTDFSFEGVERAAMDQYVHMFDSDPPPEQIEAAKTMIAEMEQRRTQSMVDYAMANQMLPEAQ